MPIRLRPHHLLCMLTFAGQGYSEAFVANLETIVERLRGGEYVELVCGPDDICAPLGDGLAAGTHCRADSSAQRDEAAKHDLGAIPELAALFAAAGGVALGPAIIADLRRRFASGSIRGACRDCEWSPLCSEIAAGAFRAARL